MNLTGILPALLADPGAGAALEHVVVRGEADVVGPPGVRAPLLAAMAGAASRPLVVVTATGREADELAASVRAYLPDEEADSVAVLPSWETLPHERLSPRADTVARRIAVFRRLAHPTPEVGPTGPVRVLIMPVRALLQPVVGGLGDLVPVELQAGSTADLTDVADRLVAAAYSRVDMVERRGEFAVRGGILDVFPPTEDHPVRVEFWGDEVSEIRWFAVADQRSLEVAEHGLWAPPCREILLTDAVRAKAAELVEQMPGAVEMLDKLSAGVAVEGMESLAPVLVEDMVPVLDLVPTEALLILNDPERVRRRAHDLVATTEEFLAAAWTGAVAGGAAPLDLSAASFHTFAEVRAVAQRRGLGWWTLSPFGLDEGAADDAAQAARPAVGDVPWTMCADCKVPAGGWCSRPRELGPPSAWSSSFGPPTPRPGWSPTWTPSPRAAWSRWCPRASAPDSSPPISSLPCSPNPTSPAGPGPPPGTCARCRPDAATWSTRSSSRPGTSSCTSSTGSAGSSRWSSAPWAPAETWRPASTW
jgi:transcription-repair coupling factor (superfamily II helicase)